MNHETYFDTEDAIYDVLDIHDNVKTLTEKALKEIEKIIADTNTNIGRLDAIDNYYYTVHHSDLDFEDKLTMLNIIDKIRDDIHAKLFEDVHDFIGTSIDELEANDQADSLTIDILYGHLSEYVDIPSLIKRIGHYAESIEDPDEQAAVLNLHQTAKEQYDKKVQNIKSDDTRVLIGQKIHSDSLRHSIGKLTRDVKHFDESVFKAMNRCIRQDASIQDFIETLKSFNNDYSQSLIRYIEKESN